MKLRIKLEVGDILSEVSQVVSELGVNGVGQKATEHFRADSSVGTLISLLFRI